MKTRRGKLSVSCLEEVLGALRSGNPVLVYDCEGREKETDIVLAAEHVTPKRICEMRNSGGGLICTAIRSDIAQRLGLPFMTDILELAADKFLALSKLVSVEPFGDKPAFSITLNHREAFTGVTDNDRALTISELVKLAQKAQDPCVSEDALSEEFGAKFRSPGHVHILIAEKDLLKSRRGHTELSIALVEMAGLTPVTVICEMLDNHMGKALPKDAAIRYARSNGLMFLEGRVMIRAYREFWKASLGRRKIA